MLTVILIGNNITNIAASSLATFLATEKLGSAGVGVAMGVMTFVLLVFGDLIPKRVAVNHNAPIALALAPAIELMERLFMPAISAVDAASCFALRQCPSPTAPLLTLEEFKTAVEMGVEEKVLGKREKELIEGVLHFDDVRVREVMTPRVRMFALPADKTIADAFRKAVAGHHSRIPVYADGNRDDIVGVVHIKDLMRGLHEAPQKRLADIAMPPLFTSTESIIENLFYEMKRTRNHIAIVVNEYGGVAGLVTMEDLLEEIVGEIMDENEPEAPPIRVLSENAVVVKGDVGLEAVEEHFSVKLPRDGAYVTVSGLLHHKLSRIPPKGAVVETAGLLFEVEDVKDRQPVQVKVSRAGK